MVPQPLRILDSTGVPIPLAVVNIYAHGATQIPANVVATGSTDADGYVQPTPMLTASNEYDFTTTDARVPAGQFRALPEIQLVVVPGPSGPPGPTGPTGASGAGMGVSSLDGKTGALLIESGNSLISIDDTTAGIIKIDGQHDALAGLTDVSLASLSSGQLLEWNGTHWVNAAAPASGVTSLDGKTGAVSVQAGNALISIDDATAGVVKVNGAHDALANLTDVTVSALSSGQILEWNGTHWVNAAAPASGVTSLDSKTGAVNIVAGTNVTVDDSVAGQIKINASNSLTLPNTVSFSASASSTTFNPHGAGNSNYYPATATFAAPARPYIIKLRALVQVSSIGVGNAGVMIGLDGGSTAIFVGIQMNSGGYAVVYDTPLAAGGSIYSQFFNVGLGTVGAIGLFELVISVMDSTHLWAAGSFNGFGCGVGNAADVDLTGNIRVYAVGAAATDVLLCQYETYTASAADLYI